MNKMLSSALLKRVNITNLEIKAGIEGVTSLGNPLKKSDTMVSASKKSKRIDLKKKKSR